MTAFRWLAIVLVFLCIQGAAVLLMAILRETPEECRSRMVWKENAKNWDEVNAACYPEAAMQGKE